LIGVSGTSSTLAAAAAGRPVAGTGALQLNVMFTRMMAHWFAGRDIVNGAGIGRAIARRRHGDLLQL